MYSEDCILLPRQMGHSGSLWTVWDLEISKLTEDIIVHIPGIEDDINMECPRHSGSGLFLVTEESFSIPL